ncbi:MAG: hypothetical protein PWQ97_446 [Tepidanaerobacteraceae bacterium]|nr:hypothetical protein [Tepidanaerobacteraceae bacterium]
MPKKDEVQVKELKPIEEITKGVEAWVVAGVMHYKGWKRGKALTKEEFDDAIHEWLTMPMKGKR